jgi:hypothetical protein
MSPTNTGTPIITSPSSSSGTQPTLLTITQLQSLPSSGGAQPTRDQTDSELKQLAKIINEVIRSHYAKLTSLPEEYLQELADKLFTAEIIGSSLKKNPSMDRFISGFVSSLDWLRSKSAIESRCSEFLKAFKAVGGNYSIAANVLHEELIDAVNTKLNCNFNIDIS